METLPTTLPAWLSSPCVGWAGTISAERDGIVPMEPYEGVQVDWLLTILIVGGFVTTNLMFPWLLVRWLARLASLVGRLRKKPPPAEGARPSTLLSFPAWKVLASGFALFVLGHGLAGGSAAPASALQLASYDREKAHQLALLSLLTYEDESKSIEVLDSNDYATRDCFEHITVGNHAALVLIQGKDMAVAFRGTNDQRDWLTNLDVVIGKTEQGLLHRGFHAAVGPFWQRLEPWLDRARDEGLRIWFTGHSMGGAMAVSAALWVASTGRWTVKGLYTFGQPAAGLGADYLAALDEHLASRYFRHVNSVDLVPDAFRIFVHGGTLCYFNKNGELFADEPPLTGTFAELVAEASNTSMQYQCHEMVAYVGLAENELSRHAGPSLDRHPVRK